jgi:predicted metal-dependent HD superfamily phosphohydrolase
MTRRHIPPTFISAARALHHAPNRFYHGVNHIDHLLAVKRQLVLSYDSYSQSYWSNHTYSQIEDYLTLAILFHDSVYNVWEGSPQNESDSINLLWHHYDQLHTYGWLTFDVNEVVKMINITAYHNKDNSDKSFMEKLMLDVDISNFAESLDVCKYNQQQIYLEFQPRFPDKEKFLAGNVSFLQSLLDRPKLYYTPMFSDKEQKARDNIKAMIKGSE